MLILIILIIAVIIVALGFRIVPQGSAYVVERLGKYRATWQSGPHVLIPGIDAVRRKVLIKEQVADFAPARNNQGQCNHADRLCCLL